MKIKFVSLFGEIIEPYFNYSILGRAKKFDIVDIEIYNPRDFSMDRNLKVDDYMIGGGAGLLLSPQPLNSCLNQLKNTKTHIVFLSPVGKKFKQNDAKRLSLKEEICFVCGRYEGIDERIIEIWANEIFSIGDFILTGGELAAVCMADAICRNLDGVLGNQNSLCGESFDKELLQAPSFTKPNLFEDTFVVSEFLKGNSAKIRTLKKQMAFCKTKFFRPDLYQKFKTQIKEKNEK